MVTIEQDHEKCIGCGNCVNICPKNWEMGDDGKAKPNEIEIENINCNKEAEESCPVGCIVVTE